ncbi:MAG: hypothetical protein WCR48_02095 [Bacteroidales bacterium]
MTSNYSTEHNRLFESLDLALKRDLSQLSTEANGGRSILFVYPPADEDKYLTEAKTRLSERCTFLDLRKLFTEFVDSYGLEKFCEFYNQDGTDIFKSEDYDDTFVSFIVKKIKGVIDSKRIPALIRTGSIYGMDFSNIDYMESPVVMHSSYPLIVFYPAAVKSDGNILFLGRQVASKYRCVVIK